MRIRTRTNAAKSDSPLLYSCTVERFWPVYSLSSYEGRPVFSGYDGYLTEECIDETHPMRFGKHLTGGPLDIRRHEVKPQPTTISVDFGDALKRTVCNGVVYPIFYGAPAAGLSQAALPASGVDAAASYGAEAWNKFKPGKPKVQASVFIAELRDLPRMLQAKAYAHRNLGKHYLSYQFGWLPFVSDLRKMYQTQQRMAQIIENIHHLNGKWIKRSGSVKDATTDEHTWSESGASIPVFDPMPPFDVAASYRCEGHHSVHTKVWFSGRFRYYITEMDRKIRDSRWNANLARKLMGLTITPGDVWEAIPWSWLIDYFSNAGDVLSNLSNGVVDELVARYAYVMRSQVAQTYQVSIAELRNGSTVRGSIERTIETKARAVADPFGFGVGGDLSSHQLAILAALGISRMS